MEGYYLSINNQHAAGEMERRTRWVGRERERDERIEREREREERARPAACDVVVSSE